MKPLCIDLFCGLGGWAEGFLAEGWRVVGFDIERHRYPSRALSSSSIKAAGINFARHDSFNRTNEKRLRLAPLTLGWYEYPGDLVLQDVLTLHGSQFRDADCIVASPPCQEYSYMAMPWSRAKQIAKEYRDGTRDVADLTRLFDACFRIQREACQAAGRHIPMVVENVKGAQSWVGRAKWHFGSFYLWGDVPALMPTTLNLKVPGMNFHDHEKTGKPGRSFQSAAVEHTKNNGGSWFGVAHNTESGVGRNPVNGTKGTGGSWFTPEADGRTKQGHWRDGGCVTRQYNSKDSRRKAASALIAKIPFELARHIAKCYAPAEVTT